MNGTPLFVDAVYRKPVSGLWAKIVAFLIVGYLCMSRSFAYLGIPQLHLFVGEVVLALFLFIGPKTTSGRWPWVAMKAPSLRRLTRLFIILLAYGIFQVFRGTRQGYPFLAAARDLAFD